MTKWLVVAVFVVLGAAVVAVVATSAPAHSEAGPGVIHKIPPARSYAAPGGIHKVRHVVIIMQENRSFDSYFGTYPGADGIPGLAGNPGTVPCVPDPRRGTCDRPYHDTEDRNAGGPHGHGTALSDIAGGKMDGFVAQAEEQSIGESVRTALDRLPARERRVLELRFGFQGEPSSLEAIGAELHLTRERVRQLARQGLRRLELLLAA